MAKSLDLDPEWGAIDLLEEVEQTFGIQIANEEAERCATVGDLYDVICAHSPVIWTHSMTVDGIGYSFRQERSKRAWERGSLLIGGVGQSFVPMDPTTLKLPIC